MKKVLKSQWWYIWQSRNELQWLKYSLIFLIICPTGIKHQLNLDPEQNGTWLLESITTVNTHVADSKMVAEIAFIHILCDILCSYVIYMWHWHDGSALPVTSLSQDRQYSFQHLLTSQPWCPLAQPLATNCPIKAKQGHHQIIFLFKKHSLGFHGSIMYLINRVGQRNAVYLLYLLTAYYKNVCSCSLW